MQLPNVKHPKPVVINGITFDIVTYAAITDEQALRIAIFSIKNNRTKFKKGKRYQLHYNLDEETAGLI